MNDETQTRESSAARPQPSERELGHWLAFNQAEGIGPARMRGLLDRFGSVEAAWRASEAALATVLPPGSLASLLEARRQLEPEACLAALRAAGFGVLVKGWPGYPPQLAPLARAPYLLYLRGDAALLNARGVAVVGTRRASEYGQRAARMLAGDLARAGLNIVSGLAAGIDTHAHQAALEQGGITVAVLGCGLDQAYPPENRGLMERIAQVGVVLSEFAPGVPPLAKNFPARNRIISGLSMATLVVEAGIKSGAVITAKMALDQGRDVFAVPGEIFRTSARGSNQLIVDGAGLAHSAEDILCALDLMHVAEENAARRELPADPAEAALLAALTEEALHIDDLARGAGQPVAEVARCLTLMEMKGMVRYVGSMRWLAAR